MTVEIKFNLTLGTWLQVGLHFIGLRKEGKRELESNASNTPSPPRNSYHLLCGAFYLERPANCLFPKVVT